MKTNWLPKRDPWMPHDYDEDVVMSVRAFVAGVANEYQQKIVWNYMMYLSGAAEEFADLSFRPGLDGERATSFAEGKRFVGMQLRKLLRPELIPDSEQPKEVLTRRMIAQRMRREREKRVNANA